MPGDRLLLRRIKIILIFKRRKGRRFGPSYGRVGLPPSSPPFLRVSNVTVFPSPPSSPPPVYTAKRPLTQPLRARSKDGTHGVPLSTRRPRAHTRRTARQVRTTTSSLLRAVAPQAPQGSVTDSEGAGVKVGLGSWFLRARWVCTVRARTDTNATNTFSTNP